MDNKKPKVFLSYGREDSDVVRRIYKFLLDNGCDPWMDVYKLEGGQSWEREIHKAIQEADFFIACLSNDSVAKISYVQIELWLGRKRDETFGDGSIFIIPLLLENCDPPKWLPVKNWINWGAPNADEKLLQTVNPNRVVPPSFKYFQARMREGNAKERQQLALEIAKTPTPLALTNLNEWYYKEKDATVRYWIAVSIGHIRSQVALHTLLDLKKWERTSGAEGDIAMRGIEEGLKIIRRALNLGEE